MSGVATNHVASKLLASADRKRLALSFILAGSRIDVAVQASHDLPAGDDDVADVSVRTITLNQTSPGSAWA
jgi:hypothetical protein